MQPAMDLAAAAGGRLRHDDDGACCRPHHHGHRARTPVPAVAAPLLLLLLLLGALLVLSTPPSAFVSAAAGSCASASDCSARGVCLPTQVCQCPAGWLGARCEFGSTAAEPIFVAQLSGLLGQRIVQEWRILPADAASGSSRRLHLRWTVNTDTWFGGILDVGWDGMTSGDSWNFWVSESSPPVVYLGDYYSSGRNQPEVDAQQDLQLVGGWRADGWQSAEWIRPLDTGDRAADQALADQPGTWVRFMWTTGLSRPEGGGGGDKHGGGLGHDGGGGTGAGAGGVLLPELSMHGYVGHCGQFRVDFAGGVAETLTDGVEWPRGYWVALGAGGGLLLLFGLLLQRDCVQHSALGWWLRSRPLNGVHKKKSADVAAASGSSAAATAPSPMGSWARNRSEWLPHVLSLQFIPTFRNLSAQELLFILCYLGVNAGIIVASVAEYRDVGRSFAYVFGHLAALHLALAILPVSRNSIFLALCGAPFDVAVKWHRRWGYLSILWLIAHVVSMILIWDGDVVFESADGQNGMGPLYGTVAVLAFLLLFFSSVEWVRRNHFEIFLAAHMILVLVGYVMALMHSLNFRWLLLVPGAMFLVDAVVRFVVNPVFKFGGAIPASVTQSEKQQQQAGPDGSLAPPPPVEEDPEAAAFTASPSPSSPALAGYAGADRSTGNRRARLLQLECHGLHEPSSLHGRVVALTIAVARSGADFGPGAKAGGSGGLTLPGRAGGCGGLFGGRTADFPPGSWLMVRVPAISHWQTHPFSVSSVRHEATRTVITLHVLAVPGREVSWRQLRRQLLRRQSGGGEAGGNRPAHRDIESDLTVVPSERANPLPLTFTEQLYNLAAGALPPGESVLSLEAPAGSAGAAAAGPPSAAAAAAPFALYLDGPYPSYHLPVFRFRALVLVAGGIGVTPLFTLLDDFIARLQRSDAAAAAAAPADGTRREETLPLFVFFCWTARSAHALRAWFPAQLRSIAACPRIRMQLHSTHPQFDADCAAAGFAPAPRVVDRLLSQTNRNATAARANGAPLVVQPSPGSTDPPRAAEFSDESDGAAAAGSDSPPRTGGRRDGFASVPLDDLQPRASRSLSPGSGSAADSRDQTRAQQSSATGAAAATSSDGDSGSGGVEIAAAANIGVHPDLESAVAAPLPLPPSLQQLHRGRPDLSVLFDRVQADLQAAAGAGSQSGSASGSVLVLSCGPERMVEDCEAEAERRKFHFSHEQFEY